MPKACRPFSLMEITFLQTFNRCLWRNCQTRCQHACATMSSHWGSSIGHLSISSTQWFRLLSVRVPRLCHSHLSWTSSQKPCTLGSANQVRKSFWVISAFIRSQRVRGGVFETCTDDKLWTWITSKLFIWGNNKWVGFDIQMTKNDNWLSLFIDTNDTKLYYIIWTVQSVTIDWV